MVPAQKDETVVKTRCRGSVTSLCKRRLDVAFGSYGRDWRSSQWDSLLWFPIGSYRLLRGHLKHLMGRGGELL